MSIRSDLGSPEQGEPTQEANDSANRALDGMLGAAIACARIGEQDIAISLLVGCDQLVRRHQVDQHMLDDLVRIRRDLGIATTRVVRFSLTPAEARLLPMLATHMSFAEIGESFSVSRNTIKTHAVSIYRKLDVSSRTHAVARATQLSLIGRSATACGELAG